MVFPQRNSLKRLKFTGKHKTFLSDCACSANMLSPTNTSECFALRIS